MRRFREVRETPLERIERNLPDSKKNHDNLDWLPDEIGFPDGVDELPDEITLDMLK
jgi:hypothetical protein